MDTGGGIGGESSVDEESERRVVRVGESGSVNGNSGSSRSGHVDTELLSSVGGSDDTSGDTISDVPLSGESGSLRSLDDGSVVRERSGGDGVLGQSRLLVGSDGSSLGSVGDLLSKVCRKNERSATTRKKYFRTRGRTSSVGRSVDIESVSVEA